MKISSITDETIRDPDLIWKAIPEDWKDYIGSPEHLRWNRMRPVSLESGEQGYLLQSSSSEHELALAKGDATAAAAVLIDCFDVLKAMRSACTQPPYCVSAAELARLVEIGINQVEEQLGILISSTEAIDLRDDAAAVAYYRPRSNGTKIYDPENMHAAILHKQNTDMLFRQGRTVLAFASYLADPNGGEGESISQEQFVEMMYRRRDVRGGPLFAPAGASVGRRAGLQKTPAEDDEADAGPSI